MQNGKINSMKDVAREIRDIVSDYSRRIDAIADADFSAKPQPEKWSKKEVVGHLIDSAQNNLRRFITSQYEDAPPIIVYQQDFWVDANGYQRMDRKDIMQLWKLLNERISVVLDTMPEELQAKECNTGAMHKLDWLAVDYLKHMKHHINQIISGSFDVIYK